MNVLKSQLLRLAADADDLGFGEAREFLLDAIRPPATYGNVSHENMVAAIKAVYDGHNKISAIKVRRQLTGEGLKEAKDWVEQYVCS